MVMRSSSVVVVRQIFIFKQEHAIHTLHASKQLHTLLHTRPIWYSVIYNDFSECKKIESTKMHFRLRSSKRLCANNGIQIIHLTVHQP